ncbi:MAG: TonB-dependent receptor [Desulfobacterales bacterium]|nr:TonB-dependent receptor [Desulfobacterales bacterium]
MKAFLRFKPTGGYFSALAAICLMSFNAPVQAGAPGVAHTPETAVQTEPQSETAGAARTEIGNITVTARKKEENVQNVPMSLSVFSNQMIEEAGIDDTSELLQYSPNVYVRDAGNNHQTVIRGVTAFQSAMHSGTGYYIDDVNIPLIYMQNPDLIEVERVEVLKGPQGALYGRNSESGVINIITRKPDNSYRGKVFGEYNFQDSEHGTKPGYKAGASLSTPVVRNKFYIGMTGKYEDSDGYIKNEYNNDENADDERRVNGRINLRWTPSENWDNALILDAMDSDEGFANGRLINNTGRHLVDYNDIHYRKQSGNTQALRLKHRGSTFDFLSVTGRSYFEDDAKGDFDMTAFSIYPNHQKEEDTQYSQEFRISSPADSTGPWSWLAGTYFFQEDLDTYFSSTGSIFAFINTTRSTDIEMKGAALFGQATYTLMDRLHITAGARYDYQDMDGTQTFTDSAGNTTTYSSGSSSGEFLPKASIAYDLTESAMAYATVAKGYMSGGYSYAMATDSDTLMYSPEYTWNYELGFKSTWLNNRLVTNLAVFYIDMEDKQVQEVSSTSFTSVIQNAAKARSYGAELEIQARPAKGWSLYGGVGYTNTKIEEWLATESDGMGGTIQYDYSGNELPNVPGFSYNIGSQYIFGSGFYGRVDLLGTGRFYHDPKNTLKESTYEIINLRLGYMAENYEIVLWANNVFDTDYSRVQFDWAGMGTAVFDGIPRQVGVTLTYRF